MNIYINAWLDCSHPFISIHDKFDDDLLAYFNAEDIRQLIENGEVFIDDLQSTDPDTQIKVATDLITFKSSKRIKQQITDISTQLKKREYAPVTDQKRAAQKPKLHITDLFPSPLLQSV